MVRLLAALPEKNDPVIGTAPGPAPTTVSHPKTGLYLHVPFCEVKCRFCDFAAFPGRKKDIARLHVA